jgi:hypothetical protein
MTRSAFRTLHVRRKRDRSGQSCKNRKEKIMSDANTFIDGWTQYEKTLKAANALNKTSVFDALATTGITRVNVTFDGEGDSGQIEEIAFLRDGIAQPIPEIQIQLHSVAYGNQETAISQCPLGEAVKDLCYDYLSQEHGGWENNDGAYGEFIFNIAERTVELEFSGRYTDVHTTIHSL